MLVITELYFQFLGLMENLYSSPNKLTNKRMAEDCENSSPPRKRNKSDSDAYSIIRVAQRKKLPSIVGF